MVRKLRINENYYDDTIFYPRELSIPSMKDCRQLMRDIKTIAKDVIKEYGYKKLVVDDCHGTHPVLDDTKGDVSIVIVGTYDVHTHKEKSIEVVFQFVCDYSDNNSPSYLKKGEYSLGEKDSIREFIRKCLDRIN